MKRILTILLFVMCAAITDSQAQDVIIGEKIPKFSVRSWLMDLQPSEADYTCILFHHSESPLCKECLDMIHPLVELYGEKINMIIITKEDYAKAGVTLTRYLHDRVGVAFDQNGRIFRSLEVSFIPFCIVCDKKREVVWCGNGARLNRNELDKILTL